MEHLSTHATIPPDASRRSCLLRDEETAMRWIAYVITNQANGRQYIGITGQPLHMRFSQHIRAAAARDNNVLQRAIRKHGAGTFLVEHIASAWDKESVLDLERLLIAQEKTLAPKGYNRTTGGDHPVAGPETLLRMGEASSLRWKDPDYRARMAQSMRAAAEKPEERARRAEVMRKRMADPETRALVIARLKETTAAPEWKARRSAAMREMWASPEWRKRNENAIKAAKSTAKGKADTAKAGRSRWADPKDRLKQSRLLRAEWADPEKRALKLKARRAKGEACNT